MLAILGLRMTPEEREILTIFIESVDDLYSSSFLKYAEVNGLSTIFSLQNGLFSIERKGPDLESVKAFILTVRFFCQDNERTSLKNMDRMIVGMNVPKHLKDDFSNTREKLNTYLDELPEINYDNGATTVSRRCIFETFLYGKFAHANPEKRKMLLNWQKESNFQGRKAQFDNILLQFVVSLKKLSSICKKIVN
jgi:hypothetical protein